MVSLPRRSTCVAQLRQELATRLLVELLVLDQLEEPAEREDRRAQLVRGDGDEALTRAVELGELVLHRPEGPRELPELVLRVDLEARREVAARHLPGRPLEALDPLAERPRDQCARDEREQERDRPREEDLAPDERHAARDVGERL